MKDVLKILLALFLYGGLGPLLGMVLATRRSWQRGLFGLMIFMPSLQPGKFMMMIGSIEKYRGHTKGYEISLIEVFAIALIIAVSRSPREPGAPVRKGLPPGTWLYLCWAFTGLLSIVNAWEPTYVLMAFSRFGKGVLIFVAAAVFLRDEKDLRAALIGLAASMVLQGWICMKMRYLDGMFQIQGWFEHQNPMSMWAYMSACLVFAAALHKDIQGRLLWLLLAAFGAAGLCVILSVSRAALAAYAAGAGLVLFLAWIKGPGTRTTVCSILGACGAVLVMLFAMDSLNSRLKEVKESQAENAEDLRPVLNRQCKAMLHDYPLLGIGWNNYGIANSRPRGAKYSEVLEEWDASRGFAIVDELYWANPLTESLYWLLLAENGWLGWGLFLMFAAATLWCALRAWLHGGKSLMGYVAFSIFVALAICYQHGTVERILTQTKNLSHWLMLAGMASGMEMTRRRSLALQRRVQ
ncbi:MAG: O-antigen ligase family protein [Prosthecobacter sp.]|uniref:O-antigen ligase family protein n=1 Tax=Prosthecobacter sp. TaxID=1965333 RepID=UPI0039000B16